MITELLHLLLPRNRFGDAAFSFLKFVKKHRRLPHPWKPRSFNDHLVRMKVSGELYEPLRQLVSDKILVKEYVKCVLGDGFTPRTLAILSTAADIDAFVPRSPCVIKPAHSGMHVCFVESTDVAVDRAKLKQWLRFSYYRDGRAANYRYLKHRLIVEEMLEEIDGDLRDFKVFCFFGEPQLIQIDAGRFTGHTRNLYSIEWEKLPCTMGYPCHETDPKPDRLGDMLNIARKLSAPFSILRVDMYLVAGRIYVGELTNCPADASRRFAPTEFDFLLAPLFEGVPLKDLAPMWTDRDGVRAAQAAGGPGFGSGLAGAGTATPSRR